MDNTTIKNIFDFLEETENKNKPFLWKIMNNEPFTDDELNIKGDLDLFEENITYIPEGLKVEDNLNLESCKRLKSLPDNLYVGGELNLEGTNIKQIPKGLYVGGDFRLVALKIKSLPKDLKVDGGLDLGYCTDLTSLPNNLKVGGYLSLYNTKITSLPEGLEVGWDLYLDYTMINTLPKGLQVDGDLSITNNPLAKLSDEAILSMIEPDGYIAGDIIREDNG
jgi:hypothetical protein